jgi:hypothetical protein
MERQLQLLKLEMCLKHPILVEEEEEEEEEEEIELIIQLWHFHQLYRTNSK